MVKKNFTLAMSLNPLTNPTHIINQTIKYATAICHFREPRDSMPVFWSVPSKKILKHIALDIISICLF